MVTGKSIDPIEGLTLCLKLCNKLLQHDGDVEDDTCLDRILSEVERQLQNIEKNSEAVAKILTKIQLLFDGIDDCHSVSAHCFVIEFASHILTVTPDGFSTKKLLDKLLLYPEKHCESYTREDVYSLSYSWLSMIRNATKVCEFISGLLATDDTYLQVLKMTNFSSMFVQRQAVKSLAAVIIKLHESGRDLCPFFNEFSDAKVSPSSLVQLAQTLLTHSYNAGVVILASHNFLSRLIAIDRDMRDLCDQYDKDLCHFFESLYCSEYRNFSTNFTGSIILPRETLRCAANCISNHPAKATGWKILLSFIIHSPPSSERTVALSIISHILEIQDNPQGSCLVGVGEIVTCREVLNDRKHNKLAMAKIFCHVLNAVASNKTDAIPDDLMRIIYSLVLIVTAALCSDAVSDKITVCIFLENSNALNALLVCLLHNCEYFAANGDCIPKLVLALLAKPSSHHSIIKHCYMLAISFLQISFCNDFMSACISASLKCLHDRRWETRDSALEFLSSLSLNLPNTPGEYLTSVCLEYSVHNECLRLCSDGNAHVRGAGLELLGNLVLKTEVFCDINTSLATIIQVLQEDADTVPRRKAIVALTKYLKKHNELVSALNNRISHDENVEKVQSIIHRGLFEDLDWEVKYNTLDILSLLISYDTLTNDSNVTSNTYVSMLRQMQDDYDDVVKEKAMTIGINLGIIDPLKTEKCLESTPELNSLVLELLSSLEQDTADKCVRPGDENDDSVILDCY